jgi:hypothetical protein
MMEVHQEREGEVMRTFAGVTASLALLFARTSSADDCATGALVDTQLTVDARDDEWMSTGTTVTPGDLIVVRASGTVGLSARGMTATPGRKATNAGKITYENGALELKIGKTFRVFTDEMYVADASVQGDVKLRVKDTEYGDNSGAYVVRFVVIRVPTQSTAQATDSAAASSSPSGRINIADKKALDESTLTPDAVLAKIMSAYMAGLKRCYKNYLTKDPSAQGGVNLSLTVNEAGRSVSSRATGFASELDSCIQGRMDGWRFPIPKDQDANPRDATFMITLQLKPD